MISNPNLILYACVAKGTTILAQFTREPDLERLALQCLERTPPLHLMHSHTVRKRTYTFLIQDPFVYFAIFDEDLVQSEGLWFLNRVKFDFEEVVKGGALKGLDNLSSHCLQKQCDPIFREVMALDLTFENPSPASDLTKSSRNPSLDSSKGMKMVMIPLLPCSSRSKVSKKKKRMSGEGNGDAKEATSENTTDAYDASDGVFRDFALPVHKSFPHDRQKAKNIWRKHVWVVLLLDFLVCAILFAVWLWVCRGFECLSG
ncbi:phytolongin Phyl2.2 [Corylus avellana]|uniref:phytolongin Phyl2.2 n=1 Tax=Corylus avellana TaxID=13451 RepID=UPI001E1F7F00|nr:phytolongin Phyl2.2 [Corylus avellana]